MISTTEFDPSERVRVKCVDGSIIETHGTVNVCLSEKERKVQFKFQLVNKQVDLAYDGIIGRDFLRQAEARICFQRNIVIFKTPDGEWTKAIGGVRMSKENPRVCTVKVPERSELIVKIPVKDGIEGAEGIVEKMEITRGVYLASSLITVTHNQAITSILNTTEKEMVIDIPELRWEKYEEQREDIPNLVGALAATQGKVQSRAQEVLNVLNLEGLNPEEGKIMREVCEDYLDIFYLPGDRLSCTTTVKHSINVVPGTSPIHTRPYRLPESQKAEIEKQVDKLLKEGVIVESNSPWNSPLLVVPKKADENGEKKWRVVVDFRKLNEKTVGDAYPLPDITEILDQLGQSKYFTCLDLVMGYHQIELEEKDKEKTAFSTKNGHWEYNRLPFGLKTAPATFQRMINTVLSGLTGTRCFVFLDDIVIYAKSLNEHDAKLREVFGRIRRHNLKLQPDKCKFLRKEVGYLGHVITEEGVRPDPEKVEVIENFPRPDSTRKLKCFLGMTGYYRKFIKNYSKIAAPLYWLLKGDVQFTWGEEQEGAFQKLKEKLISKPILQYPDFSKEFILTNRC